MKKKQPMQGGLEKNKQKYEKKSRPLKDDNAPKLLTIDIENYWITDKPITLKEEFLKFQFSKSDYFHPDNNLKEVAQKCFEWIFNPINF